MKNKIFLSGAEETIITALHDPVYTNEYVKEWINRDDHVVINAPAALIACGVKGFYRAVQAIDREGFCVKKLPDSAKKENQTE